MKIVIALLSIVLVGCAQMPATAGRESPLFNPQLSAHSLQVSVLSHGCTTADQFYLIVDQDVIELRRTQDDLCRAAPQLVRLEFAYDFGQDVFRFKNRVRYSNRVVR